MTKSVQTKQAFILILLVLLAVGLGAYTAPRLADALAFKPIRWSVIEPTEEDANSLLTEQALLQREYEARLEHDITDSLERLTGMHTVRAVVRAPLNLIQETEFTSTQKQTDRTANQVQKLSVTVLIDGSQSTGKNSPSVYQPRSKNDIKKYTDIVKSIVDFNADRGDQISVQNASFIPERGKIWGVPAHLWASSLAFLLFFALIIGLMSLIIFPTCRLLLHGMKSISVPHRNSLLQKVSALCMKYPDRSLSVLSNWLSRTERKSSLSFSPAEQAAILTLAVGSDVSRRLLSTLDNPNTKLLARLIGRLGRVSAGDIREALTHFLRDFYAPSSLTGDSQKMKDILTTAKPNGTELYAEVRLTENGGTFWEKIASLDKGTLLSFLKNQDAEKIAFILYHLPDELAGRILTVLDPQTRTRTLIHLVHIKRLTPAVREKWDGQIADELYQLLKERKKTHTDKVTDILKTLPQQTAADLISSVSVADPETARKIQSDLISWTDIIALSDLAIQTLLKYSDRDVLALALSDSDSDTRLVFARNLPPLLWQQVEQRITFFSGQDSQPARHILIQTAKELHLVG